MTKKILPVLLLTGALTFLSGCVDLFAVPGVGVSPDGSTLYFLASDMLTSESSSDSPIASAQFSSAPLGGTATVIGQSAGAFAVNPVSGDVAFTSGTNVEGEVPQLQIQLVSGGTAAPFLGADAFGGAVVIPTEMAFSPDGNWLAITGVSIPADPAFYTSTSDTMTPEQLAQIDGVLYLVDVAGASATLISDPATTWVNTIAWSPNGQTLAFNGWIDSNGDGTIDASGGITGMMGSMGGMTGEGGELSLEALTPDLSRIFLYNVGDGSIAPIETDTISVAPEFLSDSQLAYISAASVDMGGSGGVTVYDISAGTSTSVYSSINTVTGVALSPDGSQVAWTEISTDDEGNSTSYLLVSDTSFSSPQQFDIGTEFLMADAPVWMPDGSGVLVTSTNIFSSIISQLTTGMMAGFSEVVTPEPGTTLPSQGVKLVSLPGGEVSWVFQGSMINSSYTASVMSLVGLNSMDMGLPTE
jgi:hypothetical protein